MIRAPHWPMVRVMDRRALPGLVAGLIGLALGVLAAVTGTPALAVAAGAAALVAGMSSLWVAGLLQQGASASELSAVDDYIAMPEPPTAAELEQAGTVIDRETGLPDARYFELVVESRVAAARRHLWPVTIVLLELRLDPDRPERRGALTAFSDLLRQTLREADIACRLAETRFGLVLEDTSEEGGVWTAERIQIALAKENAPVRRLAAGVASYPTHGLRAEEVLGRADSALTRACAAEAGHGLGQVEVASVDLG